MGDHSAQSKLFQISEAVPIWMFFSIQEKTKQPEERY